MKKTTLKVQDKRKGVDYIGRPIIRITLNQANPKIDMVDLLTDEDVNILKGNQIALHIDGYLSQDVLMHGKELVKYLKWFEEYYMFKPKVKIQTRLTFEIPRGIFKYVTEWIAFPTTKIYPTPKVVLKNVDKIKNKKTAFIFIARDDDSITYIKHNYKSIKFGYLICIDEQYWWIIKHAFEMRWNVII
ncbi:MAG: hypothetical protein ABFS35_21550 [Bacteroidota bacterium]